MARFRRRVSFTSDGDWKPDRFGQARECRLENGHVLYCTPIRNQPEDGWQWGIYDNNQEDPNKRACAIAQGGRNWGGFTKSDPHDHLPTFEHARQQVEEYYQRMFPLGASGAGGRDSGVDYDDIMRNYRDYL